MREKQRNKGVNRAHKLHKEKSSKWRSTFTIIRQTQRTIHTAQFTSGEHKELSHHTTADRAGSISLCTCSLKVPPLSLIPFPLYKERKEKEKKRRRRRRKGGGGKRKKEEKKREKGERWGVGWRWGHISDSLFLSLLLSCFSILFSCLCTLKKKKKKKKICGFDFTTMVWH